MFADLNQTQRFYPWTCLSENRFTQLMNNSDYFAEINKNKNTLASRILIYSFRNLLKPSIQQYNEILAESLHEVLTGQMERS